MLNMNVKEFLKPTLVKIIIFVILLSAFSILFTASEGGGFGSTTHFINFPISSGIEYGQTSCLIDGAGNNLAPGCEPGTIFDINYPELIFNLIFWYVVSCLIVFVYYWVKKK